MALFEIAEHILDHDDGIVDDETDADRERHQRQIVDREADRPHRSAGAGERQWHGDAGGNGGGAAAQEQEHHSHHQQRGGGERQLHVVDAGTNGLGAVAEDGEFEPGGNQPLDVRQRRENAVHRLDDVGVRLLGNDQQHRRIAVEARVGAAVAHAGLDLGDGAKPDHIAVHRLDDDRLVVARIGQLLVGTDGGGALRSVEHADRPDRVGVHDSGAHVLHRQAHGGDLHRIDPHAHGRLLRAGGGDFRDAVDLRQPLHDHGVGGVVDRARQHSLRREREDEDRRGRRIGFAESRQGRQVARQRRQRSVERGLHVACRALDVARQVELHGDARGAERRHRGHLGHAGDLAEAAFQRRGDGGGHGRRIGTRAARHDVDGREFHRRQARHRQLVVSDSADQEQADRHQRGADRPPDERVGEVHGRSPAAGAPGVARGARAGTGDSRTLSRSM